MKKHPTDYPGVFYREARRIGKKGKVEKVYYITFKKDGKKIEEKVGRQYVNDMTPAKAALIRGERVEGKRPSPKEIRLQKEAEKRAGAERWTIGRLWVEYLKNNPKLKGAKTDKNRFKNHIENALGAKEPRKLVPLDVDRLRLQLLKKKAPATVKNVLEILRRIVHYGEKKNLCPGLSFTIQMPEVHNEKTEDLDPVQIAALLKAIEKSEHVEAAAMMRLALFTGMRRGELFKLKWEHVDFERGFITLKDPKGGPDQKIPLNSEARKVLENHAKGKGPYVFPGRGGRQRVDIKRQVNAIKAAAGLPVDFRPLHGLRHVYASMLASSGEVDMYTLQKLLTHKSPVMTQRYAHLRDDTLKRASDVAVNIISKIGEKSDERGIEKSI
jgi:integrase